MLKTYYNKLVRDKIPEIISGEQRSFQIETIAEEAEYRHALLLKLSEEAQEVVVVGVAAETVTNSSGIAESALIAELADLLEVLDTLQIVFGISRQAVLDRQAQKRLERGGFDGRLKLLWVEEVESTTTTTPA